MNTLPHSNISSCICGINNAISLKIQVHVLLYQNNGRKAAYLQKEKKGNLSTFFPSNIITKAFTFLWSFNVKKLAHLRYSIDLFIVMKGPP